MLLRVDCEHRKGAGDTGDLAGHQSNRTHTDHGDRLTGDRLRHHGVHGVAERIEDGSDFCGISGATFHTFVAGKQK